MISKWVKQELESVDIGDKRLNNRMMHLLTATSQQPDKSITQLFHTRKEVQACYRFFSNSQVDENKVIEPHLHKTIERANKHSVVLALSDTTSLNFTSRKTLKDSGYISSNNAQGFFCHTSIAVTPDRLHLGVIGKKFWSREKEKVKRVHREHRLLADKESYRWLEAYVNSCNLAASCIETQVVHITDREGDIVEIFAESVEQKKYDSSADFIIRSQHNRVIENADPENKKTKLKLRKKLKESPTLGEVEFTIPSTEKRKGRKIRQELKAVRVKLNPKRGFKAKVKVNAVMAIEMDPPEGETPLLWVFITSLPINSFEDVIKVIRYYLCRWEIELFFKVLKSGCKIEERQLQTACRMKALIAVFMALSWRVVFTMMLGRICSEIPSSDLFTASEWKSVYKIHNKNKRLPRKAPPLGEFIDMVADLGGYIKRKNGEPPGVKVMWKGMARMVDFAIAWEAFAR